MHTASVLGLFFAQFVNTALVSVLTHAATGPSSATSDGFEAANYICLPDGMGNVFGIVRCVLGPEGLFLRGDYFDLGPRWYADVGESLTLTLGITLLTRFLPPLVTSAVYLLKRRFLAAKCRHVEAMKLLYTGPKPNLPELLGKMYNFVAVVVLFAPAMPLLYPLLVVYCAAAYVTDKWYLLRICRKPIPYECAFITATLWWVYYALVLRMLVTVWAFGSLPGLTISDAVAAYAQGTNSSSLAKVAAVADAVGPVEPSSGLDAGKVDWSTWNTSGWNTTGWNTTDTDGGAYEWFNWKLLVGERFSTVSSVVLLVGLGLTAALILVLFVTDHLASCLSERLRAFLALPARLLRHYFGGAQGELGWPAEFPPFSKVLVGGAPSTRVRVLKAANKQGRGEILVTEADIDASCTARCMGPRALLLYAFGINTWRPRIRSHSEFKALTPKRNVIVGRANMSFAPHFMPEYAAAFTYAGAEILSGRGSVDLDAGTSGPRESGASCAFSQRARGTSSQQLSDVPLATAAAAPRRLGGGVPLSAAQMPSSRLAPHREAAASIDEDQPMNSFPPELDRLGSSLDGLSLGRGPASSSGSIKSGRRSFTATI